MVRANRRRRPQRRVIAAPPPDADVAHAASNARYTGSPEHKSYPSPAGPPRLRHNDATPCPPDLRDFDVLTGWVRNGIRAGQTDGTWEDGYPRYVWLVVDGECWEARHTRAGPGQYKGYKLEPEQCPKGLS